ncbi:hypothetical protein P8625_11855 [Tenacibaculum tangerinum]|uniref:Uncharacterized protein n=1 Tax=Tenacibaculum tangerinum TaxID=3038772 RepID=A0ABY8KZX3_9FLAO|nr:hypothetical protein [Tenacibaculum tangerinum]WGH74772.1 hypothetical protein P8625_11855 [Tenacibaculum tangerinum]
MKYKLYKWQPTTYEYMMVQVEKPYDRLSLIFEGDETSEELTYSINEIEKVKKGVLEEGYTMGNEAGFIGHAFGPDATASEFPEGGYQVFDSFTLDEHGDTKELFTVPLDEILKLLEDFKEFLIKNGR